MVGFFPARARVWALLSLVGLALAAGCGRAAASTPAPTPTPLPAAGPASASLVAAGPAAPTLQVTGLNYQRTQIVPGQRVPVVATLRNPGPTAQGFTVEVVLPQAATLLHGPRVAQGLLEADATLPLRWVVRFDAVGEHVLRVRVTEDSGAVTEQALTIPVYATAWRQRAFFLSAYNPPFAWREPPYDDALLARYREANFDHLLWVRDDAELMDKVHRFGLRYFLDIADFIGEEQLRGADGPPPPVSEAQLQALDRLVEAYKDDPLLTGYYICDEPSPEAFPNVARVVERIRSHDRTRPVFIDLYPYFYEDEGSPAYLEAFLQTVRPDWLPFDRYVFFNGWEELDQYLSQLRLIRGYARQYDIPFVAFIQGVGTNDTPAAYLDWRTPTEAEQRWMIYTALTYGAHGIVWFHWDDRWGVTGNPDGEVVYPAIQRLNAELQTLGPEMLPLTSVDAYSTGTHLVVFPGEPGPKLVASESELVVGVFRSSSGAVDHFMLTNRDIFEPVEARVSVRQPLARLEAFDVDRGRWQPVAFENRGGQAHFELVLEPGQGRLFRFAAAAP